jgi:flagellar M-ring protein FliF
VTVRATLNFDRLETMTESYTPGTSGTPVPRSSTAVEETYTTAAGAAIAAAVPGAAANVPGANQALDATTGGGGDGTDYRRTETTTNFEVGKTLTKNVQAVGGVKKLSVSLLLDERVPEAQLQPLQQAVSAAVGTDKERGDTVAVSRFAFDRAQVEEADKAFAAEASRDQLFGYVRMALPVIALIVGFVLVKLLLKSAGSRGAYRALELQPALPGGGAASAALAAGGPALRALPAPPPIEEARSEIEERVTDLVSRQPDMVAEVMQSWLREDHS